MYLFSEEGVGQIIEMEGRSGRIVGEVELGDTILASPAIARGALYVRSDHHLWKFSSPPPDSH